MADIIKPSLSFTIICDDIRQEVGGKVSLMGLFENIYSASFPAIHPRLAVINEWTDGKGEFSVTMKLLSPDRKTVLRETASRLRLNTPNFKHRDVSVHLNIEFKIPGTYWIDNFLDNEQINSIPLNVIHMKEQPLH